jgi:hypothetical protein
MGGEHLKVLLSYLAISIPNPNGFEGETKTSVSLEFLDLRR